MLMVYIHSIPIRKPLQTIKQKTILTTKLLEIIIQTQYIYLQDKNNKIHLYKIDKKQHQLIPINHEINHKPIQTIHKDNKHNVWSVSSDKITVIYPDLSTKEYKRPAINHNINCILIDTSTNKALFAANGEIYHYTISKINLNTTIKQY